MITERLSTKPYQFIICLELLVNYIIQNANMEEIKKDNIKLKQMLFTNDVCFLLVRSQT